MDTLLTIINELSGIFLIVAFFVVAYIFWFIAQTHELLRSIIIILREIYVQLEFIEKHIKIE